MFRKANKLIKIFNQFEFYSFFKYLFLRAFRVSGLFSLKIKGWRHNVFLRFGTTDVDVLDQIMIEEEFKNLDVSGPVNIIIDAGANIGLSSIYFSRKYSEAKIIAIEPEKSNFEVMQLNLKELKNFKTYKKALWNDEKALFIKDRGTGNWGFTITEVIDSSNKNVIETITLDYILSSNSISTIDVLKLDIEGGEKELFEKNYRNWIPRSRIILVEIHDYIKSGASRSVFNAIAKFDFEMEIMGEYLIFKNRGFYD